MPIPEASHLKEKDPQDASGRFPLETPKARVGRAFAIQIRSCILSLQTLGRPNQQIYGVIGARTLQKDPFPVFLCFHLLQ